MGSEGQPVTHTNPADVSDDETIIYAMQLVSGSILPMILKSAIELDLLEIISKAGLDTRLSPSEVASQMPTTNPNAPTMIDRILRLLAGKSERTYGLGPVAKFLTSNEDGVSVAPLGLMNQLMESWYYLKDVIHDGGIPFNKAYGKTAFEYHGTDPRFNKVFNRGMSENSTFMMKKVLETYHGFEGLNTVVDVGGCTGVILSMIVSQYPSIKGINFDLPHVIHDAPAFPGVEHVGGNMFESVPKGDAIFMKWICHDWSDEHCPKFLKNCYEALPDNGKVIIAECLLHEEPDCTLATKTMYHIDCIMLAHNPGGKERTEKEFEALAKGAGFLGFRVLCCAYGTYIMEFLKKTILKDSSKVVALDIRSPAVRVAELDKNRATLNAIAWPPRSSRLISSMGDDGKALIWELPTVTRSNGIDPMPMYYSGEEIHQIQWSAALPE